MKVNINKLKLIENRNYKNQFKKGQVSPFKGKKHSQETKDKLKEINKKRNQPRNEFTGRFISLKKEKK